MGVGAFNLIRRSVYDAVGTYQALRFEVLDDMKLGKVVKNAGYKQRVVFGQDLISVRWAKGSLGVVDNLTKNFFAVLSFQWWRAWISSAGLAYLNLGPFLGIWLAHGWARLPFAVALFCMFSIYVGMSLKSAVPPYYFFLHPVSTALFIYVTLRSMTLTLSRGGVVSASTPIVVFAHMPLWSIYEPWGWGTDDADQLMSQMRRFGSVTVLNGHIHQIVQKVEGNVTFHTARSTAYPQPVAGVGAGPGPLKVPADQLSKMLGVTSVSIVKHPKSLALNDTALA